MLYIYIFSLAISFFFKHGIADIPESLVVQRHESVLYIEVSRFLSTTDSCKYTFFISSLSLSLLQLLVFGVIICCILLSPALYKLSQAK